MNNRLVCPQQPHLTDRSLELLEPLGIDQPDVEWQFPLAPGAVEAMDAALVKLGQTVPFAVINPGATWDSKLWEMPRFGAVARPPG